MQGKNLPDSTKIPDSIMDLQRKRIRASLPNSDKLIADIMNHPVWKKVAMAYKEGMVNMTDGYKANARLIHDMLGHKISFSVCPDDNCLAFNEQINAGIGLLTRASELEPKEEAGG